MEAGSKSYPIVQLFTALEAEGIKFMLVGMSAANLQGVLATTVDVDVWIGLPSRQYMRVINLCHKLGAVLRSPNKVFLSDDTPVDFICCPRMTGHGFVLIPPSLCNSTDAGIIIKRDDICGCLSNSRQSCASHIQPTVGRCLPRLLTPVP